MPSLVIDIFLFDAKVTQLQYLWPYTAGISEFCKQLMSITRALNKESSYEISLKLDEKCSRSISYSGQIVFFLSLHYTCFSSAICPLQVPELN